MRSGDLGGDCIDVQRLLPLGHDTALCPQSPYSARPIHISAHRVYPEPSSTSVASSLEQHIRLTRDHPHRSPPSVCPLRHTRAASRTRALPFAAPTPRRRRLRISSRARPRAVGHRAQFVSPHAAPTPILRPAFLPLSTIPVRRATPSTLAIHLAHLTAPPLLSSCSLGHRIDICTAQLPCFPHVPHHLPLPRPPRSSLTPLQSHSPIGSTATAAQVCTTHDLTLGRVFAAR
ncbi:hypothetical protein B0H14DRAFT_638600 [Mycena olivaceomarginata]|nr:hypothetical protein B0H14DRAFT_638600 [Mycena olivaceomarginata]